MNDIKPTADVVMRVDDVYVRSAYPLKAAQERKFNHFAFGP